MVLIAALGDVVQEGGDVERAAIVDGADDLGRDRMLKRKLAALDVRQEADGADQMLVDREVMIHVELHHRDHAPEFGDEMAEHAGLVHAAQHAFRIAGIGHQPQEQPVRRWIGAQRVVDQPQIRPHLAQDLRREGGLLLVGKGEQADEVHRVLGKDVLVDGADAAVLDAEVGGAAKMGAALPAERRQKRAEARQRLQLLHLERRADDAGELANFLGDEEIVLHEALDGAQAGMPAIAELFRHQRLQIEAQALLGAVGEKMQLAAHRPEEALAAAEAAVFGWGEHPGLDELLLRRVGIEVLGEPVQGVQIAQAALAVLDVRLDQIARGTGAGMTGVLLLELGIDEGPHARLQHVLAEAALKLGEQHLVAKDQAGVEQRRADGHVGARQPHALIDGARGVPDLEAEIPEQIEHVFGDALAPGGLLIGKQEQEIDVRARRQHAAAVAALGDDRHVLGGGRVLGAIDVVGGEVVGEPDQGILEGGKALGAGPPVAVPLKLAPSLRPRVIDEPPQALNQRRPSEESCPE